MKRCISALAATVALALAGGVGTATAGGFSLPGQEQTATQAQTVTNKTDQSNTANAVSVNALSGNNVQVGEKNTSGDQTASSHASPKQENENSTTQKVNQNGEQEQNAQSQSGCCGSAGEQEQQLDQSQ